MKRGRIWWWLGMLIAALAVVGGVTWIVADERSTHPQRQSKHTSTLITPSTNSSVPSAPTQPPTREQPVAKKPEKTEPRHSPLAGITVGIDPGHNGANGAHASEINRLVDAGTLRKACDTTGTQSRSGYTEAAYTMDVSSRIRQLLESAGAQTIMTRNDSSGWGPCITDRARITNGSSVAVSIHADGNLGAGARGFHVIVPKSIAGLTDDIAADSLELGNLVRDALRASPAGIPVSNYLGSDGIDLRSDLGGLNLSDTPKVMIETGNMKNSEDLRVLQSPTGRQQIAQAIVDGITAWITAHPEIHRK